MGNALKKAERRLRGRLKGHEESVRNDKNGSARGWKKPGSMKHKGK